MYLTTSQIMILFNVNRARVGQIAKRLEWQFEEIPSKRNVKAKRYLAADVEATVKVDGKWIKIG